MQLNIPVAWLILNTWAPPKDKIDLSNCNLEQFPTFPGNVSIYIKEFDLSGKILIRFTYIKNIIKNYQ